MSTIYRPRFAATLSVPYLGNAAQRIRQEKSDEMITLQLPIVEAEVECNNHLQADSATVTLDWKDTTLDTRMLDDGVLTLYMGQADDNGRWSPGTQDAVFIGHVRNPERSLSADSSGELRIECIDYTGLFLEAKPFGSSGIPDYSQTLLEAWQRICEQTPGAGVLSESIVFIGGMRGDVKLGAAVAERFSGLSKIPTHPDTDAWAVWQQTVGMLGGVTYIDQDVCVVTTATDLFTEYDPPVFAWGRNLSSLSESRQNVDVRGGVGISVFDPLTGKAIEVFYPPIGDERVHRKLTAAKRKKALPLALSSERDKRHLFTLQGVTDLEILEKIAKNTWEQISRQELSGKLSTPHMLVDTSLGRKFNTLKLRSGDAVRVEFDQGQRQYLTSLPNELTRIVYLQERGYATDAAKFLAKNVEAFASLDATFYVDSVRKYMRLDSDGGEFGVDVNFINKIDVGRGAVGDEPPTEREQIDALVVKKLQREMDDESVDNFLAGKVDPDFQPFVQLPPLTLDEELAGKTRAPTTITSGTGARR